jgi:uncharacterized surface protein with fasciclin (FAS1) repeats
MRSLKKRAYMIAASAAALSLTVAACGDDSSDDTSTTSDEGASSEETSDEEMSDEETSDEEMSDEEMDEDDMAMAAPVGPGCADYAEAVPDGEGSVEGMADDPVAVAASNNPLLTTLVAAVSGGVNPDVDLVDTLNGAEFTVFAPIDDAFGAVDQATMDSLGGDADLLTSVLTYHVVPGQIGPDEIVGEQTTVQGETVTVAGEPDMLTVNGANVICGGVHTANATVYLIDSVLLPPQ